MRKSWFEHVAKTRRKISKGKTLADHRTAMAEASKTWPKVKEKLERKLKRETKRAEKKTKEENK